MTYSGKITKINSELGYGFIQVPKLGDVFFSTETRFGDASFANLKIDQAVRISVTKTERGQFASTLEIHQPTRSRTTPPEATA